MDDREQPLSHSVAAARRRAIDVVGQLKQENLPRIDDPQWSSLDGYNYGRWADKGFDTVIELLQSTPGRTGELGPAFLRRICDMCRQMGDDHRASPADVDSASSGAIDAAVWAIMGLLPPAEAATPSDQLSWADPRPDADWQLWYTDLFDRECPPSVELQGHGLARGLAELWARCLFEAVDPGGGRGFSRFHLWSQQRSIQLEGEWAGAAQLRRWLYGPQAGHRRDLVRGGDQFLHKISVVHAQLLRDGATSAPILEAAVTAADLLAFATLLDGLNRS